MKPAEMAPYRRGANAIDLVHGSRQRGATEDRCNYLDPNRNLGECKPGRLSRARASTRSARGRSAGRGRCGRVTPAALHHVDARPFFAIFRYKGYAVHVTQPPFMDYRTGDRAILPLAAASG